MTINATWHGLHAMPRNATVEERMAWHCAHREHCACRPIPPKLLAAMAGAPRRRAAPGRPSGASLWALLSGGDRRSLAQSKRARALVENRRTPARVAELASLAEEQDRLVSMRALDLLEKLAREHPDWVQPHKRLFIGPLADSDAWEIRLQVVRALPLLAWTPRERKRVVEILRRDLEHPQKFVRAWALDSLATFAREDRHLLPVVFRSAEAFRRLGSKALAARARRVLDRLGRRAPG